MLIGPQPKNLVMHLGFDPKRNLDSNKASHHKFIFLLAINLNQRELKIVLGVISEFGTMNLESEDENLCFKIKLKLDL